MIVRKSTVLLLLMLTGILEGCMKGDTERAYVYQHCVSNISDKLKAPRTAIFSTKEETRIFFDKKTYPNDGVLRGKWLVEGFVDSQNSFGAMIRSRFTCKYDQWKKEITFVHSSI